MQVVAVWCPLVSVPPRLSLGPVSAPVYCASASLLDKCRAQQTVTASTAEDGCPDSQLPHHMSQFVKDNTFKKNQGFKTQQSAYVRGAFWLFCKILLRNGRVHKCFVLKIFKWFEAGLVLARVLSRLHSRNHYFKNLAL